MKALARGISNLKQSFRNPQVDSVELLPSCGNQEYFEEQRRQEEAELKQRLRTLVRYAANLHPIKIPCPWN